MKYLIDKNNEVITTADDNYMFMLEAAMTSHPGSKIVDIVPRKIVQANPMQPSTTGTTTI
jgi:hypothetical protein